MAFPLLFLLLSALASFQLDPHADIRREPRRSLVCVGPARLDVAEDIPLRFRPSTPEPPPRHLCFLVYGVDVDPIQDGETDFPSATAARTVNDAGLQGRPRYPLATRSRAEYERLVARFESYRASLEAAGTKPATFVEVAQLWVFSLPPSVQRVGRAALKRAHPDACNWDDVNVVRYRRNENRLRESVLAAPHRATLSDVITTSRDRAMVACLYTLRRAEVAALRWRDIDLGSGVAAVVGKGGKATWTMLTPSAQAALAEWFTDAGEPPDADPVFPNRWGRCYAPQTIGDRVQRLLTKAGLWSPGAGCAHRFRRVFATEYLRANPQDLEGLRRLMRHDSIATTSSYVYLQPEDLASRVARVKL